MFDAKIAMLFLFGFCEALAAFGIPRGTPPNPPPAYLMPLGFVFLAIFFAIR